jgi:hypothetical protein
MLVDLRDYDLIPIFLVSVVIILVASEIGRMLGVQHAKEQDGDNVSTLEGAILGLLALMIGFTFAIALSRFEARRDAVVNEANSIGTTALRARLLPAPHSTEALKLLREYVQVRLDITRRAPSVAELDAAVSRSNVLQEALWQQAKAVAATNSGIVPTGLFVQTLNEMIDDQAKRLAAIRAQVPNIVLIALYGVATIAIAFAGYASGLKARRSRLPVYITGMVVAGVILLIQDLDRPTVGFITVSQQPMIDTAASIAAYTD